MKIFGIISPTKNKYYSKLCRKRGFIAIYLSYITLQRTSFYSFFTAFSPELVIFFTCALKAHGQIQGELNMIRKTIIILALLAMLLLGASLAYAGDPSQWNKVAGDPSQWGIAGDPSQWREVAGDPSQWGRNA
jgi:hypothetical protein